MDSTEEYVGSFSLVYWFGCLNDDWAVCEIDCFVCQVECDAVWVKFMVFWPEAGTTCIDKINRCIHEYPSDCFGCLCWCIIVKKYVFIIISCFIFNVNGYLIVAE